MRKVRFLTVEEFDAWMREAEANFDIPARIIDAWLDIKLALEHLYSAAMWGLDAHPSHCQYDMMVAQDALRPYEDEQKEGCTMQQQQKTYKWAVVHHIHVRTPHMHVPRIFIEGVPEGVGAGALQDLLERAGYYFGEFGIPWANHYLTRHDKWNNQVIGAYNRIRRNPDDYEVETLTYDKLLRLAQIDD
jgi:hypothetical protein